MNRASFALTLLLIVMLMAPIFFTASFAWGEAARTAPIDACALLRGEEVATALARAVQPGERNDSGYVADGAYSSVCLWKVIAPLPEEPDPDAPLGGRHFVILNAVRWPSGKGLAKKFLEAFYSAARKGDIPHTPEPRQLGDDALWWGDGLAVRKNDVSFGVSVFVPGLSPAEAERIEKTLAVRILERVAAESPQLH